MRKYITFFWPELRGDGYNDWGTSTWFIELDDSNYPSRQIEVYQNGKRLKYDQKHFEDVYGFLGDQSFGENELNEMKASEISKNEFEKEWRL